MSAIIPKHVEDGNDSSDPSSDPSNVNDDINVDTLDIPGDILLTNSQEQTILNETNFNMQNQMATVHHFQFHGLVNFHNQQKQLFIRQNIFTFYMCYSYTVLILTIASI